MASWVRILDHPPALLDRTGVGSPHGFEHRSADDESAIVRCDYDPPVYFIGESPSGLRHGTLTPVS